MFLTDPSWIFQILLSHFNPTWEDLLTAARLAPGDKEVTKGVLRDLYGMKCYAEESRKNVFMGFLTGKYEGLKGSSTIKVPQ